MNSLHVTSRARSQTNLSVRLMGACKSQDVEICNHSPQKEQLNLKYQSAGWRFGWEIKICVRKWYWQLSGKSNTVLEQTWCTGWGQTVLSHRLGMDVVSPFYFVQWPFFYMLLCGSLTAFVMVAVACWEVSEIDLILLRLMVILGGRFRPYSSSPLVSAAQHSHRHLTRLDLYRRRAVTKFRMTY